MSPLWPSPSLRSRAKSQDFHPTLGPIFLQDDFKGRSGLSHQHRIRRRRMLFCLLLSLFSLLVWMCRSFLLFRPLRMPTVSQVAYTNKDIATPTGAPNTSARAPWKPPIIDRTFLNQLSGLIHDSRSSQWPPLITQIPEPFDGPRRFLFPVRISEQESKARSHLAQIIQLSKVLNRTLVLPKVGKSRMGACQALDFEVYYDVEMLGADVISLDEFQRGSSRQSAQILTLAWKASPNVTSPSMTIDEINVHLVQNDVSSLPECLRTQFGTLDFRGFDAVYLNPSRLKKLIFKELVAIVQTYQGDPDVLVVNYDLRYPIFPASSTLQLAYSPSLLSLASRLAPQEEYVMVHWRMESVPHDALSQCAYALIDALHSAGIRKVWFASDYPYALRGPRLTATRKSSTFRDFGERHTEAVDVLLGAFDQGGDLQGFEILELGERLEGSEPLMADSGVLGILDKLIGMNASFFLSAAPGCGRKSSFTRQIIDGRISEFDEAKDHHRLRNVVDYFG
ncbi:hypothetical protein EDD18DRAFT_1148350 [Armillaria luteobubalina]|uniref:Uncharacterized protein n=1 Tax=Armillaria luteobubalina TaxID=153913 RepID=A0AA39QD17_9AGAR|nr:hypothetical protein EDD18DRAFT_1148350 [Armillaria luteobubalina]